MAILRIVDALQFSYFLTVDRICFESGSNSSFMLDGWDAVIGVTMAVGIVCGSGGVIGGAVDCVCSGDGTDVGVGL